jgi:hypothetical protein
MRKTINIVFSILYFEALTLIDFIPYRFDRMGPCNQNFGEINIFRTFITVKHFCFLLFDLISIVD